ncbi:cytochrome P450 [Hypoxylon rubiginosum]|uniref:Cytochrome P450 n=1 Tax=Hypoxylon rubiginosum TaxID=110542 RepID=A0ACB9YJC5_9PEZI|nr:cytochrome P450 [Hypoxylon rubiginosum]
MDDTLRSLWAQRPIDLPRLGVTIIVWVAAFFAIKVSIRIFYNVFLHPLRKFPGPLVGRATHLWRAIKIQSGDLPQTVKKLHDIYGPVVRIAPDELSFIESQAWKDIYGHHGSYEMAKNPKLYSPQGKYQPDTIISADREHHTMLRRQLAHGFSERSMQAQEPVIREYVDLLMCRLEEHSNNGRNPLNMTSWFNFATFDIIGNLGFGNDFGCLEKSYYHPWVKAITHNLKNIATMRTLVHFVPSYFLYFLVQVGVLKGRKDFVNYSKDMMRKRQALEVERPDLIEGLLKKKDVLVSE